MTDNNKYPYIGYCSLYYAYAIFYRKDHGIILNEGCSWLKRGSIVNENGFTVENQKPLTRRNIMENTYLDKTQAKILLNFITGKQKPNIAEMRELIILESQLIGILNN